MKYLTIILLLIPAVLQAQSRMQAAQNNAVQEAAAIEQFKTAWYRFADAVLAHDTALLRKLSAGCIRCSDCGQQEHAPGDSPAEGSSLVPVGTFLSDHLQPIFNSASRSVLKDTGKLAFVDDAQNRDLYQAPCMLRPDSLSRQKEVVLLIIDPTREKTESFQQAFSFMETPEGYKFCGYSTIP